MCGTALGDDVACAGFTLTALRRHAQFELDFVETHASTHVARNFAVRYTVADADDHGKSGWLADWKNPV